MNVPTGEVQAKRRSGYDAFISYSRKDEAIALRVHDCLRRLARPWYQTRALRVFRDKENLRADPSLWGSIGQALDNSRYFVLLASPNSAASPGVRREVAAWLRLKSAAELLIVRVGGRIEWGAGDFDWEHTTALPPELRGVFRDEPLFVDLGWLPSDPVEISSRDPRLVDSVAELAAPIHGKSKEELTGEELRQRRRTRRVVSVTIALLTILLVVSLVSGRTALIQRNEARRNLTVAEEQRRIAVGRLLLSEADAVRDQQPDLSLRLALAAGSVDPMSDSIASLQATLQRSSFQGTVVEAVGGGGLMGVGFSPRGRNLAVLGNDDRLHIWDIQGRGRRSRPAVAGAVPAARVSWTPDSRHLFVRDPDRFGIRILTDTGREDGFISMGAGVRPLDAALSANGRVLAVLTDEQRLLLWDVSTLSRPTLRGAVAVAVGATTTMDNVAVNADGTVAAASSLEGPLRIWRVGKLQKATPLGSFDLGHGGPYQMAFGLDGDTLYSGSWNGALIQWSIADRKVLRTASYRGHTEILEAVAISRDGKLLATGGLDKTVRIWQVGRRLNLLRTLPVGGGVSSLSFSSDASLLATASTTAVQLWSVGRATPVRPATLHGHGNTINAIAPNPSRTGILATAGVNDVALLWDLENDNPNSRARRLERTWRFSADVAWRPDGAVVAVANADDKIVFHDLSNGTPHRQPGVIDIRSLMPLLDMRFGPGNLFVVRHQGGSSVWRLEPGRQPERIAGETPFAATAPIALAANGGRLLTNEGGRLHVWNLRTSGAFVRDEASIPAPAGDAGMRLAGLSPDGNAVFIMHEHRLDVWRHQDRVWRHAGTVTDTSQYGFSEAAFANANQLLATGNLDGTVRLWRLGEHGLSLLNRLTAHVGNVSALAFSRDDAALFTGGGDGAVKVWDLKNQGAAEDPRTLACSLVGHGLNQDEWTSYVGQLSFRETCP